MPNPFLKWLHPPTLLAAFLLTCLILAPSAALAQTGIQPAPTGEVASAIRETNTLVQQNGITQAIALILAVGAVVITVAFILFIHRPQQKALTNAYATVIEVTKQGQSVMQEFMRDRERQRDRETEADDVRLRTVTILKDLETTQAAEQRAAAIQANSNAAAAAVNAHTDDAIAPVNANLTTIHDQLAELTEQVGQAAKREEISAMTDGMTAMSGKMTALTQLVQELITDVRAMTDAQDAPVLPPASEP